VNADVIDAAPGPEGVGAMSVVGREHIVAGTAIRDGRNTAVGGLLEEGVVAAAALHVRGHVPREGGQSVVAGVTKELLVGRRRLLVSP